MVFHWHETQLLILPLLTASAPRTLGLMALGAAAWRLGILRDPERWRMLLVVITLLGGLVGGSATALTVLAAATGQAALLPSPLIDVCSVVPLALAYAAGLLLVLRSSAIRTMAAPFAAVGQMALTNYLLQSIALSLVFFGYGFGLSGRMTVTG